MRRDDFYKSLIIFVLLLFGKSFTNYCLAADPVYATSAVAIISNKPLCVSCKTVFNLTNAQSDNGISAELISSAGYAVGLGAYRSQIELRFSSTVSANTTSYIRIDSEGSLLQSLLGGSLGSLISDVLGSVLLGNQEIIFDARTSSGSVLSRSSIAGFDTDRVRLVSDEYGNYYVAITPASSYDRIRITNQVSSAAGLNEEYTLDVFHAFYFEPDPCGSEPIFTSYDGSGITLEVLELNDAIEDPNDAIDGDLDGTFSQITLGVVGVAGTVEQMIYFNSPILPGNEILISMATGESLLDLGLLNYVELVAYSDGVEVSSTSAASLLDLDVLGLLASNEFFKFPISDDLSAIDQIGIRVSSLVGAGLLEGTLKVSGVTVSPIRPEIPDIPEEGYYEICYGQSVTVTPTNKAGGDLNWFRLESGSEESLGIADVYTTAVDLEPGEYDFLVKANTSSCTGESEPSRFKVKVNPIPSPANYDITPSGEIGIDGDGKYTYVEGVNPVTLNPNLIGWVGDGDFDWFLDESMLIPIQDGDVIGDVLYEIENDNLTMTGLEFRDETDPYKFYLNWTPVSGCGPNEVKELDLSSIAKILHVSLISFEAKEWGIGQVKLDWILSDLYDNEVVVLERSGIDLQFEELATFSETGNFGESYIDTKSLAGDNYYRIQVYDEFGQSKFISQLLRFHSEARTQKAFSIYPNDFDDDFTLISEMEGDIQAHIILISGDGNKLKTLDFKFSDTSKVLKVTDLGIYPSGNYVLQVYSDRIQKAYHLIKK